MLTMDNVTSELLLEVIKENNLADVPGVVTVVDYNIGTYTTRDGDEKPWANLEVTDTEKLELLRTVNLEGNAKVIKVKLGHYQGESLDILIDKKLSTDEMALDFTVDRFSNITGLVFKTSLDMLDVVE